MDVGWIEGFIDDLLPFLLVVLGGGKDDHQSENTRENAKDDREDIDKLAADDTHREMKAGCKEADADNGNARPDPRKIRAFVCEMLLGEK